MFEWKCSPTNSVHPHRTYILTYTLTYIRIQEPSFLHKVGGIFSPYTHTHAHTHTHTTSTHTHTHIYTNIHTHFAK